MPKAELRYAEDARADLAEIFEQRREQRGDEGWDSARAYVAAIVETINGLADYPERGPSLKRLVSAIGGRFRMRPIASFICSKQAW